MLDSNKINSPYQIVLTNALKIESIGNYYKEVYYQENSITAFSKQMRHHMDRLKTLNGLIKSEAYEQTDNEGIKTTITLAVWKNEDHLNKTKTLMQAAFKRINFNP